MFITAEEIKSLTSFDEVRDLPDERINYYIERADSWIYRATGRDFTEEENRFIKSDLKIATMLLVEYLYYWDHPDIKTTMMGPEEATRLGSYQVNYKNLGEWREALPGENTGVKELDSILRTYKSEPSAGLYFKVLGKGSK